MEHEAQQVRERWIDAVRGLGRASSAMDATQLEEWLEPSWRTAVQRATWGAEPIAPRTDVLTMAPFRLEWCHEVLHDVAQLQRFAAEEGLAVPRPNSMNGGGLVLDDVGYAPLLAEFCRTWLTPFAQAFYPDLGVDHLDEHHGFVVEYERGADEELSLHVDDSELTLNLCLGAEFTGGDLYFLGRRCLAHVDDRTHADERLRVPARPGVAVLHAGKDRHGAAPITSGRRLHLILWARSSTLRRQPEVTCPDWCLDRRLRRS